MKKLILIIPILFLPGLCFAIGQNELPFGSQFIDTAYTAAKLQQLENLGFNYFMEYDNYLNEGRIDSLYNHRIQSVRGGVIRLGSAPFWDAEAPFKYSHTNYAIVDVGSSNTNTEVCMLPYGGIMETNCWVSTRGPADTLTGAKDLLSGISTWTNLEDTARSRLILRNGVRFNSSCFFPFFPPLDDRRIKYRFDIYISVDDSVGDDSLSDVAYVTFELGGNGSGDDWAICHTDTVQVDTIKAYTCQPYDSMVVRQVSFAFPINQPIIWQYPDSTIYDTVTATNCVPMFLFLDIATTGKREVTIDKIVISDQYGRNLLDGDYDALIDSVFEKYESRADKIYGWYLMDEPSFTNFMPFEYIQELMKAVDTSWTIPVFWRPSSGNICVAETYLSIVQPDIINPDIYVFGGSDPFCGPTYQQNWGPMERFNAGISWMRAPIDRQNRGDSFWLTIQTHETHSMGDFRTPTASELSCQAFAGLAWGVRGLGMWWYQNLDPNYGTGILEYNGTPTELYDEINDHLGPYVQAVDEFYMPLVWDTCYDSHNIPGNAIVHSLHGWSDSANPDTGWAQIGEFQDTVSGDKYIMLVNRACSSDNSGTEAPDQHFTLRLNPSTIGSDYLLITDLADSLRHASGDTGWVGIPRTTYSATMPDGYIPYTITLKAGEGKLIQIAQTSQIQLSSSINTNYTYQGRISVLGDASIASSHTMRIKGPAFRNTKM